ncbi:MAG TPA: PAS domain S-box protein [Planctomycetaceae bacterium]|nr:PAS domain S-box protein [Planctomycetaceae bacterium]
MGHLNILTGLKSGTEVTLGSGTAVLGREADCEIFLPDKTVSRRHAQITFRQDGYYLEDLQSRNGTYVNGQKIQKPLRLSDQDQIQLYDVTLTYCESNPVTTKTIPHQGLGRGVWPNSGLDLRFSDLVSTETVAEMDVTHGDPRNRNNAEIRLQLILEITRCLESPFEREKMLSRLLEWLVLIFPQLDRACIFMADDSGRHLNPVAVHQGGGSSVHGHTVRPISHLILRQVMGRGKAVLSVDRMLPEEQMNVLEQDYCSQMCAPLMGNTRKPFGVIYVDSDNPQQRFTPDDLNILTCVAILTGQALEQESQHSARFRAVVDHAVDGIITMNENCSIESVNPAIEKLFGFTSQELIGEPVSRLIPQATPKLFAQTEPSEDVATNGKRGRAQEMLAQKKDGTKFPIHLSMGSFELGGKRYTTGILHDISERKIAELRLKLSQQELKDFVENAVIGLHWLAPNGKVLWANRAELELLGYASEDYVGHDFSEFHADPDTAEELREKLKQGQELRNFPARLRCQSGKICDVLISSTIFRRDGEIVQHRCFTRDITEKKKAEEELQALNETLEQKVRDRTQSVKLLQNAAVIANEAESITEALEKTLNLVCDQMNWPYGHAYLADPHDRNCFMDSGVWTSRRGEVPLALMKSSAATQFHPDEGLVGQVISTRRPKWFEDTNKESPFTRTCELADSSLNFVLAFPILMGDQVVGVLEFFASEIEEPDNHLLELMTNIGTQLGRIVERRRMQEELIDAVWEQQRYFGQELHDTLGQELTGIGMMVNSLARKLEASGSETAQSIREVGEMIQQAKTGVRRLAKGLFPVEVDAEGLRAALEDLARMTCERCSIDCKFSAEGTIQNIDNSVATHLFRIAQEAVNNAVKHSRANHIRITLESSSQDVELLISDDGRGIDQEQMDQFSGMGLRIMRYRANLIGASFEIGGNPGEGTELRCHVHLSSPLTPKRHENGTANGIQNQRSEHSSSHRR